MKPTIGKERTRLSEWFTIVLRSLGAVAMLFLITRILGKKQISQLTFFEYVIGITLGELAGFISTDIEAHYLYGVTALLIWFLVPYSLEWLTLKNRTLRNLFEGKGRILIKDGKVLEDNLKKERLSADELLEQLRNKNAFRVADVEFAVMEPDGKLSVLLKKENVPLTAKELGLKRPTESEPYTVVTDGKIVDEMLSESGHGKQWLMTELEKMGVALENVFIGQVDATGGLYVDLFDDKIQAPKPQTKALLFATVKKCAADLELYALTTTDKRGKALYERCAADMNRTLGELEPLLNH
jgi:uncharacterized membrane protein YcaP (DUF421 family)